MGRLAGRIRQANPQIIHQQARRSPLRSRTKRTRTPKKPGTGDSLSQTLRARYEPGTGNRGTCDWAIAKVIIGKIGSGTAEKISAAIVEEINENIAKRTKSHTAKSNYARAAKRILRYLWEYHGAPKLDGLVRVYAGVRPRNVVATDQERAALLAAAPPFVQLYVLLCSDLAIRSGTVMKLGPEHYDPARRKLTFTTKYDEKLSLPTTAEIETLLLDCNLQSSAPFVRQLWEKEAETNKRMRCGWNRNAKLISQCAAMSRIVRETMEKAGITRNVRMHDFRRRTAVRMLEQTKDLRYVQALLGHRNMATTLWYVDHNLFPINAETLEELKKPYLVERKSA